MQISALSCRASPSESGLAPQAMQNDPRSLELELDEWVNGLAPEEVECGFEVRRRVLVWQRRNQGLLPAQTTSLELRGLQLTSVPAAIGLLQNLHCLDLSGNELTEVPPAVWELSNLVKLHLRRNAIEQISAGVARLRNLRFLDLRDNRLTNLPAEFGQLHEIDSLVLANNRFQDFPETMGQLRQLKSLSVGQCALQQVPPFLRTCVNLQSLDLSGNEITELPDWIGELRSLVHLSCGNNQITAMPHSAGELTNLDTVELQNNSMRALPTSLGRLTNLRWLYVDDNPDLNLLPADIANIPPRCFLTVAGCPLSQDTRQSLEAHDRERRAIAGAEANQRERDERDILQTALGAWANEVPAEASGRIAACTRILDTFERARAYLDLSNLNLTSLPDEAFQHLNSLEKLMLDGNSLALVPLSVLRLPRLVFLSISRNRLERFPDVALPPTLQTLLLSHNRLTAIPPHIGQHAPLVELDIQENPALAQLPDDVVELARRCQVTAAGCRFPPELAERLAQADAQRLASLDQVSVDDIEDVEVDMEPGSFAAELCDEDTRRALATDGDEPIADAASFFDWLDLMSETADFRADREDLEAKLKRLIQDLLADVKLRKTCFVIAFDALATCGDNVALGLNNMYLAIETAKVLRPGVTEKQVIDIGVDMFVMSVVTRHGQRKIADLATAARAHRVVRENPDDVETMLYFQTGLRSRLEPMGIRFNLPVQDMRYAGSANVTPEELDAAATQILQEVRHPARTRAFLAAWTPLQEFVEVMHAHRFDAINKQFYTQLETLESDQGSASYREAADQIMTAEKRARTGERQRLINELLNRHFLAAKS